jgi:hypothetical protein
MHAVASPKTLVNDHCLARWANSLVTKLPSLYYLNYFTVHQQLCLCLDFSYNEAKLWAVTPSPQCINKAGTIRLENYRLWSPLHYRPNTLQASHHFCFSCTSHLDKTCQTVSTIFPLLSLASTPTPATPDWDTKESLILIFVQPVGVAPSNFVTWLTPPPYHAYYLSEVQLLVYWPTHCSPEFAVKTTAWHVEHAVNLKYLLALICVWCYYATSRLSIAIVWSGLSRPWYYFPTTKQPVRSSVGELFLVPCLVITNDFS